jgi:hypothetical protein
MILGWSSYWNKLHFRRVFCHSFRLYKRGFCDFVRKKPSSLLMLGWSLICHFPDVASGFPGRDTAILKLDAAPKVYAVLSHN